MAERVGFEPTEPVKAHSISNAANSTTLAPFRRLIYAGLFADDGWFVVINEPGIKEPGEQRP